VSEPACWQVGGVRRTGVIEDGWSVKIAAAAFAIGLLAVGVARAQWEIENSNTTADLRGIHSVGGGVAWASGTNGTVLRTEDGGYVWQTCAVPPGAEKLDFRGIQAFDANTAIVMSSGKGDLSRLYKTTDGCHTWKLVFTNPDKDGFWDALYFDGAKSGWILGDPVRRQFTVFTSSDAGRTWLRLRSKGLEARAGGQGAFAASNSSVCGGSDGEIKFGTGGNDGAHLYLATDREIVLSDQSSGATAFEHKLGWERRDVPVGSNSESSGVFSIAQKWNLTVPPRVAIVAVGGDYLKPEDPTATAAWADDNWETWHASTTSPHGYRSAVAYDASTKTWITVGPNGTDISTDDGKNWRALKPDPARHEAPDADRNWNALSLPFVVGPKGRIGKLNPAALKK